MIWIDLFRVMDSALQIAMPCTVYTIRSAVFSLQMMHCDSVHTPVQYRWCEVEQRWKLWRLEFDMMMNDIVKSFDIWMPIQYCENVVTHIRDGKISSYECSWYEACKIMLF